MKGDLRKKDEEEAREWREAQEKTLKTRRNLKLQQSGNLQLHYNDAEGETRGGGFQEGSPGVERDGRSSDGVASLAAWRRKQMKRWARET